MYRPPRLTTPCVCPRVPLVPPSSSSFQTLNIPFGIVVTKTDMLKDKQNVLEATLHQICTLLKRPGMRRHPVKIKTAADIVRCAQTFHSESVVPIFQVSNVTMDGIPDLHKFLNLLPKRTVTYDASMVECHLDASWMVPGIGTVVGGHLMSGTVAVGDKLWFGPHQNSYVQVTVRTIHCKRVPLQRVAFQSYVCLALKGIHKKDVKKGNVLVSTKPQQLLCARVCADVQVLKTHSTTIRVGYQPILHSQNSRCSVTIASTYVNATALTFLRRLGSSRMKSSPKKLPIVSIFPFALTWPSFETT